MLVSPRLPYSGITYFSSRLVSLALAAAALPVKSLGPGASERRIYRRGSLLRCLKLAVNMQATQTCGKEANLINVDTRRSWINPQTLRTAPGRDHAQSARLVLRG
jgi:hypothetical protein